MDRRNFLQSLAASTTGIMLSNHSNAASEVITEDKWGPLLPQRKLGKTNEYVTMLGLGGAHVSSQFTRQESERLIDLAIEGGIRFFDTATIYGNGESEKRYGLYLTPKYRDEIFLMTKTNAGEHTGTTADTARQHLEDSLRNMKTDHLDLWTFHEIMSVQDVQTRIDKGIIDVMIQAKEEGKVRHIGFSGHKTPEAHKFLLEYTDVFETCQMPVSCADPTYGSFINNVMPTLLERSMGILGMKTLAAGGLFGGTTWFKSGPEPRIVPERVSVEQAVHFSWSLPIAVLITGPNNLDQLQEKIDYAHSFTGLTEEQRLEIVAKGADLTKNRGVEFYKATGLDQEDPNLPQPFTSMEDWRIR